MAAADVDGDGDIDVLSASAANNTIAWYENDGSENFTTHAITTSASGAYSVAIADVDGDGDMDVLSASISDNTIAWYENDGSENFTAHTITSSANTAVSVATADVDGDGDLDVLSASITDNTIAWYENDGSENFTTHAITTTENSPWTVTSADVDGDGDLDVLSGSNSAIVWYENDGSESFTAHTITSISNVRSVAIADVDDDGDIDVLSASTGNSIIAWYDNNTDFGPVIDSATYDASTGVLTVSRGSLGTGLVSLPGTNNDIDASLLTLTGQGSTTYTLTDTPDVEITDENSFSLTLSATDKAAINALLNQDGSSALDSTLYNLSLASGYNGSGAVLDATNGITVSNAPPIIARARYHPINNQLTVIGAGFVGITGSANDIDASTPDPHRSGRYVLYAD